MKLSLNKAGSMFKVISTSTGVITAASVHANKRTSLSTCIRYYYGTLAPLVRKINNVTGVGNVNVNTPGNGCCAKGVRLTPGLP